MFVNTEITCLNDVRNRNFLKFRPRTRNEFRRRLEQLLLLWLSIDKPNKQWFRTIHRLIHAAVHPIRERGDYYMDFYSISSIITEEDRWDFCIDIATNAQIMHNRFIEHQLIYYLTRLIYEELTGERLNLEDEYGVLNCDFKANDSIFMHPLFYNDGEAIARLRNPADIVEELYLKHFRIRDEFKTRISTQPSFQSLELRIKEIEEHEKKLTERERIFAASFNSSPAMVQELFSRAQALANREREFEATMNARKLELERKYEEFDRECEEYEINSTRWKAEQEHLYLVKSLEFNRREESIKERESELEKREIELAKKESAYTQTPQSDSSSSSASNLNDKDLSDEASTPECSELLNDGLDNGLEASSSSSSLL